ncbi:SPOC domain-like protein [Coniophora puteana RWD-64-598 SS2]|uniref:ATP-dependent DNA helicase II subunit 2 n=1 Tax=Coniophora puteana (strain RWD-64-598) TaxID=741705 RepID=A0A5M3N631_CONPW|nr:SPOC domain-like protein [Coniophora puteana RWD-64-598 SS2]EIW86315.1 SPOC domain-like protein [Coniophora puteana RWD-64-598 SS2]
MVADRAGYTVTMFLVDISPSMVETRIVDLPPGPTGEERTREVSSLEYSLQYVKLRIQDMIFHGRKTEQCGVIIFGSDDTHNVVNEKNGGYDHVTEFIPIGQPNATTLAKLDTLKPSETSGDPIDALIVAIETQDQYLEKKRTWTRKIVLLTDGKNPMEIEDWEATVHKMNALHISLDVVGIDFDDEEIGYQEEGKKNIKFENEAFYAKFTSSLSNGEVGTFEKALQERYRPEPKDTKSTLMGTMLRLGDVDVRPDEAMEVLVKTSKCTMLERPKSWKKFARRQAVKQDAEDETQDVDGQVDEDKKTVFSQLRMRTEYYVDHSESKDDTDDEDNEEGEDVKKKNAPEKVEKEQLIRGFKYGATYAPCPDGQFPKLPTKKGIDICGFFHRQNFRRDFSMGEVQYVWADPSSALQQVTLSSVVQAMADKDVLAIARWVMRDGADPKMGVLCPSQFDKVDCLLWVQMPFADDVRKYTFAPLEHLVSKKGDPITTHPYLPTSEQMSAMENFVDAMDLMDAGEKDEDGHRQPWFDTRLSYNPAIHRTKQALYHSAIVNDVVSNPLAPPHPELVMYFDPPKRAVKRAREAVEECQTVFKVKEIPKRAAKRARKDGHVRARDDDEEMLLLDLKGPKPSASESQTTSQEPYTNQVSEDADAGSETESEDEELLLDQPKSGAKANPPPTPARLASTDVDPGRERGRIIGTTYPLQDFKKNIAQGDLVTKAVEDMAYVIKEIVLRPFASRRHKELISCLTALRETCLKEDEIDAWNKFLRDLKESCLSPPGNPAFWAEVKKSGRGMSLISSPEAANLGGVSDISESTASNFIM